MYQTICFLRRSYGCLIGFVFFCFSVLETYTVGTSINFNLRNEFGSWWKEFLNCIGDSQFKTVKVVFNAKGHVHITPLSGSHIIYSTLHQRAMSSDDDSTDYNRGAEEVNHNHIHNKRHGQQDSINKSGGRGSTDDSDYNNESNQHPQASWIKSQIVSPHGTKSTFSKYCTVCHNQ